MRTVSFSERRSTSSLSPHFPAAIPISFRDGEMVIFIEYVISFSIFLFLVAVVQIRKRFRQRLLNNKPEQPACQSFFTNQNSDANSDIKCPHKIKKKNWMDTHHRRIPGNSTPTLRPSEKRPDLRVSTASCWRHANEENKESIKRSFLFTTRQHFIK